jgi:MFS family permease
VLALRFVDRVGKGLRTSPRDALIADVTPPELRGAAYGLHRAMDHAGAVLGPLAAAALLLLPGMTMRQVFLLAFLPGVVVMVLIAGWVKEPARPAALPAKLSLAGGWRGLGAPYRRLLLALVVFTLGNSTDAFLLLRLSDAGLPPERVALLWAAFNAVKLVTTAAGGRLSDRWPRKSMIVLGWVVYALVYAAFAALTSLPALVATFLLYGLYYGLTEPAEKAWVVDLVPGSLRGTAFGYYHGSIGLAALPASLLFGLVWSLWGAPAAFLAGSGLAAAAALLVLRVPGARPPSLDVHEGPVNPASGQGVPPSSPDPLK